MKLICSAGHIYDTENISHVWWKGERREKGNCPEVMGYDRMSGTRRCQKRLVDINSVKGKKYLDETKERK